MAAHGFDPNAPGGEGQGEGHGGERVAKALARAGIASRREVEKLIEAGRVVLNGKVLKTPAVKVSAGDVLTVDGKVVGAAEPTRLFRYHKPAGLVTTHADPKGRPTVFRSLPPGLPRVISVGRLDLNSEGLLLLTNDGALARALELPATALVRRYRARARGRIDQAGLDKLKDGITVEGVRYGPIEATLEKAKDSTEGGANLWITVALTEGKNREVRKVLQALGLTVNRLIRLSYGPLALGTLAVGAVEEVGPRVLREQFGSHIPPENLPGGDRPLFQMSAAKPARRPSGPAVKPDAEPRPKPARKAGWAKPKAKSGAPRGPAKAGSGSGPGVATRAGPGGPSRSSSPPRKSGARPKGPPRSGGPRRP